MTIAPDQGMAGLYPERFAPPPAPPAGPGPALEGELDIGGRLVIALDNVTAAAQKIAEQRRRDRLSWDDCHPIDITANQSNAAGFLTDERWQPRATWAWQVLLLTVVFGAGATAAVLYQTASADGALAANALNDFLPDTAGIGTWEPKGLILLPGHQLALQSAGGGVTMRGKAVEIALPRLAEYLM